MNKKITLQDIIEGLIQKHSMERKDAEAFVKGMFDLIEETLSSEKIVKIKGLGTFKLIDVDSRESINVNSGERFRIEGHSKVSFIPDASLKNIINKPFSHFETVILNENTKLEDTDVVVENPSVINSDESSEDIQNESIISEQISSKPDFTEDNSDKETNIDSSSTDQMAEFEIIPTIEEENVAEERVDETVQPAETDKTENIADTREEEFIVPTPNVETTEKASDEDKPAIEEPDTEELAADSPAIEEQVSDASVIEEPVVIEQASEEQNADASIVEESATEEQIAEEPVVIEQASEEQNADASIVEESATEEQIAEEPVVIEQASEELASEGKASEGASTAEEITINEQTSETAEEKATEESATQIQETTESEAVTTLNDKDQVSERITVESTKPVHNYKKNMKNNIILYIILAILIGFACYLLFVLNDNTSSIPEIEEEPVIVADTVIAVTDTTVAAMPASEDTIKKEIKKESESIKKGTETSTKTEVKRETQKPEIKEETQKSEIKEKTPKTAENKVYDETIQYKISGTKATHTIQEGEGLMRISLEYYGTKKLYTYILEYNKSAIGENGDKIRMGMKIKIPELKPLK